MCNSSPTNASAIPEARRAAHALSLDAATEKIVTSQCYESETPHLKVQRSLSLRSLRKLNEALKRALVCGAVLGRLGPDLVLSFPSAAEGASCGSEPAIESKKGKKRGRAEAAFDLARQTMRRLAGEGDAAVKERRTEVERVVANMVALRTLEGLVPLESYAVSRRPRGSWGAEAKGREAKDKDGSVCEANEGVIVIVACRIAQGAALRLEALCDALGPCEDGMVTVDEGMLDSNFRLPHSTSARSMAIESMIVLGCLKNA